MALTISLTAAIASTRTVFTITDGTTYGTGGNPARSAVGVFLSCSKMDYESSATALTVTGNNSDPETDSSWTIEYTDDGWYRTYFVIIPDFDNTATYNIYDSVFNPSDDKVYRSKANSNTENDLTNTTWWEEITSPASLAANKDTATESENITSIVYNRVFSANGQYEFANQLSAQCLCTDCDESETLANYNVFAMLLDEIAVADSRTEVLKGELACRKIESRFIDC